MKKRLIGIMLCIMLVLGGAQTALAAPVRYEEETAPVSTTAPQTTTTSAIETNSDGTIKLTREQDIAVIFFSLLAIGGGALGLAEKARKNKRGPLRRD